MALQKEKSSIFEIIATILKVICALILIILIVVLALQRFSDNTIAVGGYRVFSVATGSMIPVYDIGDVIVVKDVDVNKLSVGDDITYMGKEGSFSDRIVTHRIISIEDGEVGKIITTQGVANPEPDPKITGDQVYGKVVYKSVIISFFTKIMNDLTKFYITMFIPFALLIFLQIKDNMDEKRKIRINASKKYRSQKKKKIEEDYDDEDDDDEDEDDDDEDDDDEDDDDYEDDDDDDDDYDDDDDDDDD